MTWLVALSGTTLCVTTWILTGLLQRVIRQRDRADAEIARMAPAVAIMLNKAAWDDRPGLRVLEAAEAYRYGGVHPLVQAHLEELHEADSRKLRVREISQSDEK